MASNPSQTFHYKANFSSSFSCWNCLWFVDEKINEYQNMNKIWIIKTCRFRLFRFGPDALRRVEQLKPVNHSRRDSIGLPHDAEISADCVKKAASKFVCIFYSSPTALLGKVYSVELQSLQHSPRAQWISLEMFAVVFYEETIRVHSIFPHKQFLAWNARL